MIDDDEQFETQLRARPLPGLSDEARRRLLADLASVTMDNADPPAANLTAIPTSGVCPEQAGLWNRIKHGKGRLTMRQRIALGGVGTAAALGFLLVWVMSVTRPVSAMERMAENIRKAKSLKVTMTLEQKVVRESGKPPVTSAMAATLYWLAPKSYRTDLEGGQLRSGMNHTDIFPAGMPGIHIDHKTKRFQRVPARLGPVPPFMMLDKLSTFSGKAARNLGTKKINGAEAWGFEVDGKKIDPDSYPGPVEVWLDADSNLPVFLCYKMKYPAMPAMTLRMEDFQWNIELNPKFFLAEAPTGYVEEQRETAEHPGPEKVLQGITFALKTYAELCGRHYPHITRTFGEPVRDEMYRAAGVTLPLTAEQMMPGKPYRKAFDAFQGFAVFNRVLQANPDVAYYGKTVGPKDKDKVLLRWKLDDGRYQVIFGDLRAETVTAEKLRVLEGK